MSENTDSLASLVERAQRGERAALEALLEALEPRLYRFGLRMCRDPAEAEDLVQEAMLAVVRGLAAFEGRSSISTWVFSIARNACLKHRRRSRFAPAVEESLDGIVASGREIVDASDQTPESLTASRQLLAQVQAAMYRLPPDQREILVLRDVEGLSAREVADVVGVSLAAVKSRIHRARGALREDLATQPYAPQPGCPNIRQIFSEHLEGDLSTRLCAQMEAHVETCAVCAAECEGLRTLLSACQIDPQRVPETLRARVRSALRTHEKAGI